MSGPGPTPARRLKLVVCGRQTRQRDGRSAGRDISATRHHRNTRCCPTSMQPPGASHGPSPAPTHPLAYRSKPHCTSVSFVPWGCIHWRFDTGWATACCTHLRLERRDAASLYCFAAPPACPSQARLAAGRRRAAGRQNAAPGPTAPAVVYGARPTSNQSHAPHACGRACQSRCLLRRTAAAGGSPPCFRPTTARPFAANLAAGARLSTGLRTRSAPWPAQRLNRCVTPNLHPA